MQPQIIKGGRFTDARGAIRFANGFTLMNVQRFYTIEHADTQTVRAWQGHPIETKYFFPIRGTFVIAWVNIDNFSTPSDSLRAAYTLLGGQETNVLHIPPGHANGLRALEANSILGVFSDLNNEASLKESIRYPSDKWFNWFQNF